MYNIAIVLLMLCVFVIATEAPIEIDSRWITRPSSWTSSPHAVYIKMSAAKDEFCSGTLLNPEWVLTAARCFLDSSGVLVEKNESIRVYVGVQLTGGLKTPHVQMRESNLIWVHDTGTGNIYHSVGLIKVSRRFNMSDSNYVKTVTLTTGGFSDWSSYYCRTGSFGKDEWTDRHETVRLKTQTSEVMKCDCQQALRKNFPNSQTDYWICSQSQFEKCKGDFGAGLMCEERLEAVAVDIFEYRDPVSCNINVAVKSCVRRTIVTVYLNICFSIQSLKKMIPSINLNHTECFHSGIFQQLPNMLFVLLFFSCSLLL